MNPLLRLLRPKGENDMGKVDSGGGDSSGIDSGKVDSRAPASKSAEFFDCLRERIAREQEIAPFDLLGRSLSYNPYPPRFREIFPRLQGSVESTSQADLTRQPPATAPRAIQAIMIKSFAFAELETIIAMKPHIIVLDLARDASAAPSGEGLECVGYLRHYTSALIILKDCFLEPYQILQALVYGADGIALDFLPSNAKALLDFAFGLNLMSFCLVRDLKELKRAILARSEGLLMPESSFNELASLTPKHKCLAKIVRESSSPESKGAESSGMDSSDIDLAASKKSSRADFVCVAI